MRHISKFSLCAKDCLHPWHNCKIPHHVFSTPYKRGEVQNPNTVNYLSTAYFFVGSYLLFFFCLASYLCEFIFSKQIFLYCFIFTWSLIILHVLIYTKIDSSHVCIENTLSNCNPFDNMFSFQFHVIKCLPNKN